jgi:hypothetical protein
MSKFISLFLISISLTKGQNLLEYFKKRFDEAQSIEGLGGKDYRQYFSIFSSTISSISDEEFDKIVNKE